MHARKRNPNESYFAYAFRLTCFFSQIEQLRKASKFEDEIRMEQEERKREEEEKAARREQFRQKAALFGNWGVKIAKEKDRERAKATGSSVVRKYKDASPWIVRFISDVRSHRDIDVVDERLLKGFKRASKRRKRNRATRSRRRLHSANSKHGWKPRYNFNELFLDVSFYDFMLLGREERS